jgi:hypothetical protein
MAESSGPMCVCVCKPSVIILPWSMGWVPRLKLPKAKDRAIQTQSPLKEAEVRVHSRKKPSKLTSESSVIRGDSTLSSPPVGETSEPRPRLGTLCVCVCDSSKSLPQSHLTLNAHGTHAHHTQLQRHHLLHKFCCPNPVTR